MVIHSSHAQLDLIPQKRRRQFLGYMVGSTTATVALGYLWPVRSAELTLEDLCSIFPLNSRCKDYLPGVQAKDEHGHPIQVDQLLTTTRPESRIPVKGLFEPSLAYLVITAPPIMIAEYAINPTCTHLGCTVAWKADENRFVCPCHGSRYDNQGLVIHGPARRNLGLLTVVVKQNRIRLVARQPAIDPRVQAP